MEMKADIILYNGIIRTQDARTPKATAVAVNGNRILDVGSDEKIMRYQTSATRIIDLENRLLLPGFTDTHFHFYEWALNYESIDFSKTRSFKEMQETITIRAGSLKKGEWVLGQGFNESDWPENRLPDRLDLDRAAPNHPVCIWRCDLHLAVANSLALTLAGIDKSGADPDGGVIVRDAAGKPTGVLKELAPDLIRSVIPPLDDKKLLSNMKRAMKDLHALGLTSIHDIRLMGGREGKEALKAWQTLHRDEALSIRCHVALPGEKTDEAVDLGLMTGFGDDFLKIGHLKFFSDGGMGARTGWMIEPYLDADCGMPLTPVSAIEKAVKKADRAGLSCMVHAIGDRANREIIRMFQRIEQQSPGHCRIPHRIEHMQMVRPEDLEILSQLKNTIVTCQPNNLSLDISMIEACVGERARYIYPLKSIMDTNIPVMLGSDAPVADKNPLAGIYSAVTRKRMDFTPKQGWHMEQALSVEAAVKGYTFNPAVGSRTDVLLGSVTPGKYADMVVLEKDIFTIDVNQIPAVRVDFTLLNGNIVYERE